MEKEDDFASVWRVVLARCLSSKEVGGFQMISFVAAVKWGLMALRE